MTVEIRPLETLAEIRMVEDLQREVWGDNDAEIVPLHMLTTVAHNGGVLLGAWDAEAERLAGFVFGFLGTDAADPRRLAAANLKHCSHMMGVSPDYRDQGVGLRLKLAQRERVMQQGVRLITWTYDPLESRNAHLNIARLGCICKTYLREVYGEMQDDLNRGLPSDRFQVEWWVTSARVKQKVAGARPPLTLESFTSAGTPILNPAQPAEEGLLRPAGRLEPAAGILALVEIPSDFQSVKSRDVGLAREWKFLVRDVFEAAFQQGYLITDFVSETVEGRLRKFYVLSQGGVKLDGGP
jgi:predicted GNAT superfamily acetyltransferase